MPSTRLNPLRKDGGEVISTDLVEVKETAKQRRRAAERAQTLADNLFLAKHLIRIPKTSRNDTSPTKVKRAKKLSVKQKTESVQFEDKPPQAWTSEDVRYWLKEQQFGREIIHSFTKERIAGDFLLAHVNDSVVLKELGLTQSVQRKRLRFELAKEINRHQPQVSVKSEPSSTTATIRVKKERRALAVSVSETVAVKVKSSKSSVAVKTEPDASSGKRKRSRDDMISDSATAHDSSPAPLSSKKRTKSNDIDGSNPIPPVTTALSAFHLVPAPYRPLNSVIPLIPYPQRPKSPKIRITSMLKKEMAFIDRIDHNLNPIDYDVSVALDQLTANPLMSFQFAKTGKSKCRACNTFIQQNSIRLGVRTYFGSYSQMDAITAWYHPRCGMKLTTTHDATRLTSSSYCMGCELFLSDILHVILKPELQQLVFIVGPLGDKRNHFDCYCQCCAQLAFSSRLNCSLSTEELRTVDGFNRLHPVLQQRAKDIIQKSDLY